MEETLKEFGLTQGEIQVYLAALKLGMGTAGDIAQISKINRTNTYDILESLKSKGLMSSAFKKEKQYFEAANPERLISIAKEREQKILSIIPELHKIQNSSSPEKAKVMLFEGMEGIKTLMQDMLKTGDEIKILGCGKEIHNVVSAHMKNFLVKCASNDIKTRLIVCENEAAKELRKKDAKEKRQIKFLDINVPLITFIYDDKVVFLCLDGELYGLSIKSGPIAHAHKLTFESFWPYAK